MEKKNHFTRLKVIAKKHKLFDRVKLRFKIVNLQNM